MKTSAKAQPRRMALLTATLALALAGCRQPEPPPKPQGPMQLGTPANGAYTGAFVDFGDNEDNVTLDQIEDFEQLVGKHQALIASSSYWGEQTFPTDNLNIIWRHGSVPLVLWSPWDQPYEEDEGPDKYSLNAIIDGKCDDYIDHWADSARDFGHPIMVSFANEQNGMWFPWSGTFYGSSAPLPAAAWALPLVLTATNNAVVPKPLPSALARGTPRHGSTVMARVTPQYYEGPETFKKAYRHVVDRVRARGASNILWVFHVNNYSMPYEAWNLMAQYYPGSNYVDWLGLSVYGEHYSEDKWTSFVPIMDDPYQEISRLDPTKPIMLSEWGVGEFPTKGNKAAFIAEAMEAMRTKYPRLKAAIFWHERWQNDDDTYSNLRVNSSPESLAAYRHGVADPFWLDAPQLVPMKPTPGEPSAQSAAK